jgi:hypothetical protein
LTRTLSNLGHDGDFHNDPDRRRSFIPKDRVIDGTDPMPVLASDARSAQAVIFGHQGPRLAAVRGERWKPGAR